MITGLLGQLCGYLFMGLGLDCNRDYDRQICGGAFEGPKKSNLEAGLVGSVPGNVGVSSRANMQNQGSGDFLSAGTYSDPRDSMAAARDPSLKNAYSSSHHQVSGAIPC